MAEAMEEPARAMAESPPPRMKKRIRKNEVSKEVSKDHSDRSRWNAWRNMEIDAELNWREYHLKRSEFEAETSAKVEKVGTGTEIKAPSRDFLKEGSRKRSIYEDVGHEGTVRGEKNGNLDEEEDTKLARLLGLDPEFDEGEDKEDRYDDGNEDRDQKMAVELGETSMEELQKSKFWRLLWEIQRIEMKNLPKYRHDDVELFHWLVREHGLPSSKWGRQLIRRNVREWRKLERIEIGYNSGVDDDELFGNFRRQISRSSQKIEGLTKGSEDFIEEKDRVREYGSAAGSCMICRGTKHDSLLGLDYGCCPLVLIRQEEEALSRAREGVESGEGGGLPADAGEREEVGRGRESEIPGFVFAGKSDGVELYYCSVKGCPWEPFGKKPPTILKAVASHWEKMHKGKKIEPMNKDEIWAEGLSEPTLRLLTAIQDLGGAHAKLMGLKIGPKKKLSPSDLRAVEALVEEMVEDSIRQMSASFPEDAGGES